MILNLIGPFVVNAPFGTEIAFAKGLRRIGHSVVEVDPNVDKTMDGLDWRADATVVFKSCCGAEQSLTRLNGPVVVYQPDDARFDHIRGMIASMRLYSDLFLSFDSFGVVVAKTMGYRAAETLLLTADDELYSPSPEQIERDIDVSFIGSLGDPVAHASRRKMIEIVRREAPRRGWKTWFGQTQDLDQLVDVYRRSKVVLNHATDVGQKFGTGFGLQCRHFEVAMTRTCLFSNETLNEVPLGFSRFDSEQMLVAGLDHLLISGQWEGEGRDLYTRVMAAHRPEHRAQQLVSFIEKNC